MSDISLQAEFRRSRISSAGKRFMLDVRFELNFGISVFFGPSASGKSTLLKCLAGLIHPDDGRITIAEDVIFDSAKRICATPQQRRLGYVSQSPALFPHLTVEQNVAYGLYQLDASERVQRVSAALSRFHIESLTLQRPDAISGGEQQRVALARAVVTRPRALLFDEPFAALDYETKSNLMRDLKEWNRETRTPVVLVTHALDEVFALGDFVLLLEAGHITGCGKPEIILRDKRDRLVQELTRSPHPLPTTC